MRFSQNIFLSNFSSFKIGGRASYFTELAESSDLEKIISDWKEISSDFSDPEKKIHILGGGTNLLFNTDGLSGLTIFNIIKGIEVLSDKENVVLKVGSGTLVEELISYAIENNLSGLEWAGGLPGTLGGAVRGNAGAFGGEIKDVIKKVISIDLKSLEEKEREKDECDFGYRNSIFKKGNGELITYVEIVLSKRDREEIIRETSEKIDYRRQRHPDPDEYPNLGSTFKNIPVDVLPSEVLEEFREKIKNDPFPLLPAVKLIAGSGLTGKRVGDIEVSKMHPNYLVNLGNGKSEDVLSLIKIIKEKVKEKYRVDLEEEITQL